MRRLAQSRPQLAPGLLPPPLGAFSVGRASMCRRRLRFLLRHLVQLRPRLSRVRYSRRRVSNCRPPRPKLLQSLFPANLGLMPRLERLALSKRERVAAITLTRRAISLRLRRRRFLNLRWGRRLPISSVKLRSAPRLRLALRNFGREPQKHSSNRLNMPSSKPVVCSAVKSEAFRQVE